MSDQEYTLQHNTPLKRTSKSIARRSLGIALSIGSAFLLALFNAVIGELVAKPTELLVHSALKVFAALFGS